MKFFGVDIIHSKNLPLIEHALCNLKEIEVHDEGIILKSTYCEDHGIFMVYEEQEDFSKLSYYRTGKGEE